MNLNYPHREAVVVRNHDLRVTRRFATESEITARPGERVAADRVLGHTDPRLVATRVPVADQLDVAPADVARFLMRPVGAAFAAGEPLARMRRGVRNVIVAAPVAGTLIEVEAETGTALLAPAGAGEVRALVPGDIEHVEGKHAVVIRTVGSRVLGIVGLGGPATGAIHVATAGPEGELTVAGIGPGMKGAIVVAGRPPGSAALKKLIEVGAAGLVTGGLVGKDLAAALGWQAEDRLAPWRPLPGERAIGEGLPVPLTLLATEGFGPLAMNPHAFALLAECQGRFALLQGTTRVVGALARPEVVIPDADALDGDAAATQALPLPGAAVRLTDQAGLGRFGTVVGELQRIRLDDGTFGDAVEVELAVGGRRTVRMANLEVVASA